MKQLTKEEIIDETVAYYSEDTNRRAMDENGVGCSYLLPDGKMCAVGRCISNPGYMDLHHGTIQEDIAFSDADFLDQYEGYGIDFWSDLQDLHDANSYWDGRGITQSGKHHVKQMKERWVI